MKTVLTHPNETKTYTGYTNSWPCGLYESVNMPGAFICVYLGYAIGWHEGWGIPARCEQTPSIYTRIPGYTGRIASITPEHEGGAE